MKKIVKKMEYVTETSVKLVVKVSAEEWASALDKAFEKVVKEVKVDGFRPGKMPKALFIRRFGWESLYNDALDFVLQESYPKAIEQADIYPVSQPQIDLAVEKLTPTKGFDYTVVVDVIPPVQLGEYKGLKVKTLSKRVTKKNVDEYIKKQLEGKVENVIKEGPAELGDTVVIDFKGFLGDEPFEGGEAENYELELGSNSFIPGFEDQLVGTTSEQEVEVKVTFPTNYHESLAGKDATFKVTVHEVKSKVYPKLTDELVKEFNVENVSTVAEYKVYVENLLKQQKEEAYEKDLTAKLVDKAVSNAKVLIPQSLIDQEVERMVKDLEAQAAQYKVPTEVLLQYMGLSSVEAYKKQAAVQAEKSIKEELVLSEIVKVEKLDATQEEILAEYEKVAGITEADSEEAKQKKLQEVVQRYPISRVAYHLNMQKAVKFLRDNAIIK